MKNKNLKRILSLLFILVILFGSTGCWDRIELEEQAFVIMLGLDKGKTGNNVRLTVMVAIPSKIAGGAGGGGGGGGGGKQEQSVSIISMEVPSIFGGLNSMNTFVSRRLNLQHTKMLVIGEQLAKDGVGPTLGAINRFREIRRSMVVLVGRPTAEDYIKALQPKLGTSPSKYIEDIMIMADNTGAIPKAFYHEFLSGYESGGDEAFAMLGSARGKAPENPKVPELRDKAKTDLPGIGDPKREAGVDVDLPGTAVFNGQRLAGELNGDETRIFNMLRGKFRRAFMTFRDPIERDKIFVIDLRPGSSPKIKTSFSNGRPVIDVTLSMEGDLVAYQSLINYAEDDQKRGQMEGMVSGNLKERANKLVKKSQEQFDTDIFGFGNYARINFLTFQDWTNYHWLQKFKNAQVNIKVKFKIRRIGMSFGPPKPVR